MTPRAWMVPLGALMLVFGAATVSLSASQVVPAGTVLNVRTTQLIDADTAQVGTRYRGIVDDPVNVDGRVVIPRGTPATLEVVNVEHSSNMKGRDRITLKVLSVHLNARAYPVSASYVELKGHSEGKRATRKVLGGAGIGAAVG